MLHYVCWGLEEGREVPQSWDGADESLRGLAVFPKVRLKCLPFRFCVCGLAHLRRGVLSEECLARLQFLTFQSFLQPLPICQCFKLARIIDDVCRIADTSNDSHRNADDFAQRSLYCANTFLRSLKAGSIIFTTQQNPSSAPECICRAFGE